MGSEKGPEAWLQSWGAGPLLAGWEGRRECLWGREARAGDHRVPETPGSRPCRLGCGPLRPAFSGRAALGWTQRPLGAG